MSQPSPVLVVGSINIDLVIRGTRLPAPGETVLGGEFYQAAGGKGANQAVAAARAATNPVTFIGAVGSDPFGAESRARFQAENLVCDYIRTVAGEPTGVALILVDAGGQNLISVASGANARLLPADLEEIPRHVWESADVFLTNLESPLETVAHGLRLAREYGLTTILNPAPAPAHPLPREVLRNVDVLTPNETEAALLLRGLAGVGECFSFDDPSQAERAALQLRDLGCGAVIVTLGARGCLVIGPEPTWIPAISVEAVDATAAGDAFNGALAAGLSEGRTLVEAAKWAGTAAAISVTRRGAQPSLPMRTEIEELYRRQVRLRQPERDRSLPPE
jgi:ribokinase